MDDLEYTLFIRFVSIAKWSSFPYRNINLPCNELSWLLEYTSLQA